MADSDRQRARVWGLAAGRQRAGAPTSAAAALTLAALPDVHLIACGAAAGVVTMHIMRAEQSEDACKQTEDGVTPRPTLLMALQDPTGKSEEEPVRCVAWGGGGNDRAVALVAVAGQNVYLMSLQSVVDRLIAGEESNSDSSVEDSDPADHGWKLLAMGVLSAPLTTVFWVQACDGVLVSDTSGRITMLHVHPRWLRTAESVHKRPSPGQTTMEVLWQICPQQTQDLIAAGAAAWAPSATAAAGGMAATVWWPQPITPHDAQGPSTPVGAPGGDAEPPQRHLSARAERLRHPCPVTGMQWSPGGNLGHTSPQASGLWGSTVPDSLTGSSDGAPPALLTTGGDGALRLWIEVRLPPALSRDSADGGLGAAIAYEAHFCCTLVVSPQAMSPDIAGAALCACWGRPPPDASSNTTGAARRAAKVLWLCATARDTSGAPRMWLWAVDRLFGVTMNGLPNQTAGSRLLAPPRVVLWGSSQLDTSHKAQSPQQVRWRMGAPAGHTSLSCHVCLEYSVPAVSVVECWRSSSSSICIRSHTVDALGTDVASPRASSSGGPFSPSAPPAPAGGSNPTLDTSLTHLPVTCTAGMSLGGHTSNVKRLAISPDGQMIASAAAEGPPLLWRTADLSLLGPIFHDSNSTPCSALLWIRSQGTRGASLVAAHGRHAVVYGAVDPESMPQQLVAAQTLQGLATAGSEDDHIVQLWQLGPSQHPPSMSHPQTHVVARLRGASGCSDRAAVWNIQAGETGSVSPTVVIPGVFSGSCEESAATAVAIGPVLLTASGHDQSGICINCLTLPEQPRGDDVTNTSQLSQLCQVSCQGVTTVCIDGDGRYLAAVTDGGKRLCIWRAHLEGCTLRYRQASEALLSEAAQSLAWVPMGGGLNPLLAVATMPGSAARMGAIQLFGRLLESGSWSLLAELPDMPSIALSAVPPGFGACFAAACGAGLALADDRADIGDSVKVPLAAAVAGGSCGFLAAHHPDALLPALSCGMEGRCAAAAAVRAAAPKDDGSAQEALELGKDDGLVAWSLALRALHGDLSPSKQQQQQQSQSSTADVDSNGRMRSASLNAETQLSHWQRLQQISAPETGTLNMSTCALTVSERHQKPQQQQQKSFLDTGMLDMSSFGMANEDEDDEQQQQQQQQQSSLNTGMLDMSAFGMAEEDEEVDQQQQQQQRQSDGNHETSVFPATSEPLERNLLQSAQTLQQLTKDRIMQTDTAPVSQAASNNQQIPQLQRSKDLSEGPSESLLPLPVPDDLPPLATSSPDRPWPKLQTPRRPIEQRRLQFLLQPQSQADHNAAVCNTAPPLPLPFSSKELQQLQTALCIAPPTPLDTHVPSSSYTNAFSFLRPVDSTVRQSDDQGAGRGNAEEGGPTLPGLDRAATVRVVHLMALVLEQATGSETTADTASQLWTTPSDSGQTAGSSGSSTPLDTAARSAVFLFKLGIERSETRENDRQSSVPWLAASHLQQGVTADFLLLAAASHTPAALLDTLLPLVPRSSRGQVTQKQGGGFLSAAATASSPGGSQLKWSSMQAVGAGFWLTDLQLIRVKVEELAKAQYSSTRDPAACALLYIALGKKTLLQGLFRVGSNKRLADFLARNFSDPENAAAAAKNAYVLLGQHKPELAAAFFLLGGGAKDAIGVCATEMADPQLALLIARLMDSSQRPSASAAPPVCGPLLTQVVSSDMQPGAAETHDKWAQAVLCTLVGNRCGAAEALLQSTTEASQTADGGVLRSMLGMLCMLRTTLALEPSFMSDTTHMQQLGCLARGAASVAEQLGQPLLALQLLQLSRSCEVNREQDRHATVSSGAGASAPLQLAANLDQLHLCKLAAAAVLARLGVTNGLCGMDTAICVARSQWHSAAALLIRDLESCGLASVGGDRVFTEVALLLEWMRPPVPKPLSHLPPSPSVVSIRSRHSSTTGSNLHSGGPPLSTEASWEVLRPTHGRLTACVAANGGNYGLGQGAESRPVAAAATAGGLLSSRLLAPSDSGSPPSSAVGTTGGWAFSGLVSTVFDAVRWPPESSEAVGSSSASGSASPSTAISVSRAMSFSFKSDPVLVALTHAQASAQYVQTSAMTPHPTRPLFLSGSAGGEVYLWRYGDTVSTAGFTPVLKEPEGGAPRTNIVAAPSLTFISTGGSGNVPTAATLPGWHRPTAVRFSQCGERFAAIGEGGLLAAWGLGAPRKGSLGRADWTLQVLQRRGCSLTYLCGSSTVVVAGGMGNRGSNAAMWDTAAPPHQSLITALLHHQSTVTQLAAVPGGRLLASGDETGSLVVTDMRMNGSIESGGGRGIWESKERHAGGVTALASGITSTGQPVIASGSKDGLLRLWSASRGTLIQTIETAQYSRGRNFFAEAIQQHRHEVKGLQFVDDGLTACGMDGAVRFFPFTAP